MASGTATLHQSPSDLLEPHLLCALGKAPHTLGPGVLCSQVETAMPVPSRGHQRKVPKYA